MRSPQDRTTLADMREQLEAQRDPVVRDNVERHFQNLERLAGSLRALGLDQQQVDAGVVAVFQEYEERLLEYMASVKQAGACR